MTDSLGQTCQQTDSCEYIRLRNLRFVPKSELIRTTRNLRNKRRRLIGVEFKETELLKTRTTEESAQQFREEETRSKRPKFRETFLKDNYKNIIKSTYFEGIKFRDDSGNHEQNPITH